MKALKIIHEIREISMIGSDPLSPMDFDVVIQYLSKYDGLELAKILQAVMSIFLCIALSDLSDQKGKRSAVMVADAFREVLTRTFNEGLPTENAVPELLLQCLEMPYYENDGSSFGVTLSKMEH